MICTESRFKTTRKINQKVIYKSSSDETLELAVDEVVNGAPGDISYWLRYRDSKDRYRDGNKSVFEGDELQDDPSDPDGSA